MFDIDESIFRPLGMQNSTFLLRDVNQDLLAMPHIKDEVGNVVVSDVVNYTRHDAPSGHLYSNVVDMARWASANLGQGSLDDVRILTESAHNALWSPYIETGWGDTFASYGFGWFLGTEDQRLLIRHAGGDIGFQADIMLVSEESLFIVAMGNYLNGDAEGFYASDVSIAVIKMILDEIQA